MITDVSVINRINSEINSMDKQWKIHLKNNLHVIYQKNLLSDKRLSELKILYHNISNHIMQIYPHLDVYVYGSIGTGLANRKSDLDISILTNDNNLRLNQTSVETLKEINDCFQSMKTIPSIESRFDAKVPIITFKTKNNISGDISANNINAINKTLLIRQYCDLYPKILIMGKLIKHFTEIFGIADASKGTLPSTAYIVMLIHFLKRKYNLPLLTIKHSENPSTFGKNAWPTQILPIIGSWRSRKQMPSIDVLWIGFLKYYTIEFDVAKEVVNISTTDKMLKSTKGWQNPFLAIEDPNLPSSNFGENVNETNYNEIRNAFSDVLLKRGKLNTGITETKRKRRKRNKKKINNNNNTIMTIIR